ncbi:MAG: polyprenyl synthetase family protein [Phycisphaerae bacterium]|nr:polyprenyl synthetase family protein [Phycisphaerae bacterium]
MAEHDKQLDSATPNCCKAIPADATVRGRLLEMVRLWCAKHEPVAPLTLNQLRNAAKEILEIGLFSSEYDKYVIVLLNNQAWMQHIAGVAFNRRLLLLPRCLRDTDCPAEMDQFGLLCRHCGKCPISGLQKKAEQLGYVVLVAEGSPIVMSLIRSGKVDALIGVSCMNSLEEMFPIMTASAVPGIAIPLFNDGCKNTSVDLEYLNSIIELSSNQNFQLPDINLISRAVEHWFHHENFEQVFGKVQSSTEHIAYRWMAENGKRRRPVLTAAAAAALLDNSILEDKTLQKLAIAMECFHKASLIHDDIEDNDDMRYQQESMHIRHGLAIALNAGDLLLGEGYRLIAECDLDPACKNKILLIASQGHRMLCVGQGRELYWRKSPCALTVEQTIEIFRYKTSPAFNVALQSGALFADADDNLCQWLSQYCDHLGIAYQIQDDLEDQFDNGQSPSILAAIAYENACDKNKAIIESHLKSFSVVPATIIASTRATDKAGDLLDYHKNMAIEALSNLSDTRLKTLLRRMIARVFDDD